MRFIKEKEASGISSSLRLKTPLTHLTHLRYYATYKVDKFEPFFYKVNIFLQKTTTCIGLQAE